MADINDADIAELVEHGIRRANAKMFAVILQGGETADRAAKFGEAYVLWKALNTVRDYLAEEVRFADRCAAKGIEAPRNDDVGRSH